MTMTVCPSCGGPMRPLLFSWFCPRDCDRPASHMETFVFEVQGRRWQAARVDRPCTKLPGWVTRGWNLYRPNGGVGISDNANANRPFRKLVEFWLSYDEPPGWHIESRDAFSTWLKEPLPSRGDPIAALVFGPVTDGEGR